MFWLLYEEKLHCPNLRRVCNFFECFLQTGYILALPDSEACDRTDRTKLSVVSTTPKISGLTHTNTSQNKFLHCGLSLLQPHRVSLSQENLLLFGQILLYPFLSPFRHLKPTQTDLPFRSNCPRLSAQLPIEQNLLHSGFHRKINPGNHHFCLILHCKFIPGLFHKLL